MLAYAAGSGYMPHAVAVGQWLAIGFEWRMGA
jgi:hypothetical protein